MADSSNGCVGLDALSESIRYIRASVGNNVHMPLIELFLVVAVDAFQGNQKGITKVEIEEKVGRPSSSVNKHAGQVHLTLGLIEPKEDKDLVMGRRYRYFLTEKGWEIAHGLERIYQEKSK